MTTPHTHQTPPPPLAGVAAHDVTERWTAEVHDDPNQPDHVTILTADTETALDAAITAHLEHEPTT